MLTPDGRLELEPEFVEKRPKLRTSAVEQARSWLLARSRTLQLWDEAMRRWKAWSEAPAAPAGAPQGVEVGLANDVYRPPSDAIWTEAWRVTEALVRAIEASARAKGVPLVIASLSNGVQVLPDPAARARYAAALGVADLLYPDRRVEAWAKELAVPFVMLAPELADWAEANGTCVHGFPNATPCGGHWNEHGHRIAGERIARRVCAALGGPVPAGKAP